MFKKNMVIISLVISVISAFGLYLKYASATVNTFALSTSNKTIVIDPGHGGFDPGKVGNQGTLEKDINLNIALKLRSYLQQSGAYVVMTREEDTDLDGDNTKSLKKQDMINRVNMINDSDGDILVSIHQNAFPDGRVRGAQVFYYEVSKEGESLASSIQEAIRTYADKENKRVHKSNTDYYMLKTTKIPSVIVECGFLTNSQEEDKLNTDKYQEEIAWSIYLGIIEYFETE